MSTNKLKEKLLDGQNLEGEGTDFLYMQNSLQFFKIWIALAFYPCIFKNMFNVFPSNFRDP